MTYDDIEVNGIVVLRRRKDNWLNANQILKVAGLGKKTRESILQRERVVGEHEMVLRGATKYRGTWINFERGRELCKRYGVEELLYPLLTHHMSI
jgi:regulatory protein SWI6